MAIRIRKASFGDWSPSGVLDPRIHLSFSKIPSRYEAPGRLAQHLDQLANDQSSALCLGGVDGEGQETTDSAPNVSGVARGLLQGRPLQLDMGWGVGEELTKR